jgi:hypothetical protein
MSGFASFPDFPLRDTLGGGKYRPNEHYLGGGADQLYFGRCLELPGERCLINIAPDSGLALGTLGPKLMKSVPGFFEPVFVGHFDALGEDRLRDLYRAERCAFVEKLPSGDPLRKLIPDMRPWAVHVGLQVGELLATAWETRDPYLVGLRPEYVWIRIVEGRPVVTGLGGRSGVFFGSAARGRDLPSMPLFTHKYYAPEVFRGEDHDDRALVLTLAVMVAEWALGEYPYAMDSRWGFGNLSAGKHRPLSVGTELAEVLSHGLRPKPSERPHLATFLEGMRRVSRETEGQGLP